MLPILRARAAARELRVVFAGSEPGERELKRWRESGVQCVANPVELSSFYRRARVVVNPLQKGSGVNLKMIEALASGRPVVATPTAVRGLPAAARPYFAVGSTPDGFASAVLAILDSNDEPIDQRRRAQLVNDIFGPARLQPLIRALHRLRPPGSSTTAVVVPT